MPLEPKIWRSLYVSAALGGGGALRDVESAVRRLSGVVRELEEVDPADPEGQAAVDVTFHLPGPILRPDYEGLRTGRWDKTDRLLVIQVAVPEVISGDAEAINVFLATSIADAIELATDYLDKRSIDLSLHHARSIAEKAVAVANP